MSRLKDNRFVTHDTSTGSLPSNDVRGISTSRDGSIWIATAAGLAQTREGRFRVYTTKDGLSGNFVRTMFADRAGTLWVGTVGNGVTRIHNGTFTPFRSREGLSADDVRAFFEDRQGNLWIGTTGGGLNRLKNSSVVTYGTPEGLSHDIALPITADTQGTLWVGTYGGGLNRFRDGRWTAYSRAQGLSSDLVLSLASAGDGSLWIGTAAGLDRLRAGQIEHYGSQARLADEPVLALLEDRRGDLWVGTRTGLRRVSVSGTVHFTSDNGLGGNVVTAIAETRDGAMWVATSGGGLSRVAPDGIRSYTRRDGLPGDISTISEGPDGALWLGTAGNGLLRLREGRFSAYPAGGGGIGDSIFRILPDGAGHLWMSGNQGIFRVGLQDLEDFDAGQRKDISTIWYDETDGMRSSETNGGIHPAGWRTADGRLWFPTIKGVAMIDPARLIGRHQPTPAVVEQVIADGERLDHLSPVTVAPGARAVEIHYTSPDFHAPHRTAFRYRLDGYDPEWVDAGTRRTAYYTNIRPGRYVFRVTARNPGQDWSRSDATIRMYLTPYFHQTRTFYGLVALAVALLGFGGHRLRVSGLRAREQELLLLAEERRRAFDALRASEAQFRALFDNVFEGVYRSAPDGRLLLANRAFIAMLGYESMEQLAVINTFDLYVQEEDRRRFVLAVEAGGEVRDIEVTLRRTDGGHVTAVESARAIQVEPGGPVHIEGTLVDITRRKELENQNRQLQKMEVVGRLAGGIAHDFNNLLTPILGYCDILLEDLPAGGPHRADVEEIRKAAESAGSLTGQLLAFSRQQILEPRVFEINGLMRKIEKILRRLIGEHIDLKLRLDPAAGRIKADAGQIEQVVLNLVINARDAMGAGGTLTVTTATTTEAPSPGAANAVAPDGYVTIAVSDTGHGIPPHALEHLFQPFFTTKRHGTGLGLSTVHDIVTRSRGHIAVDSEQGRGATFRVYLPQVEAPLDQTSLETAAFRATGTGTVLLAEDNDALRELAHKVLARGGYTVLPAKSAEEARVVAARHGGSIDLLLTDVVMPGGNGPALAEDLQRTLPGLKILFMTGYIDDEVSAIGRPTGSLLQKPFTPATLLERVRETLDPGQSQTC